MFSSVELALASSSRRRMELLDCLGIAYQRCPVEVDESPHGDEKPEDYVARVAADKAMAAHRKYQPDVPILAADTIIVFDGKIFGKPLDKRHARRMLLQLSGNKHTVLTAVILINGEKSRGLISRSTVWFDELSPDMLTAYLNSGEFEGKAGAYAVQGQAQAFISRIDGSFSGIMGLPLHTVASLLEWAGIKAA